MTQLQTLIDEIPKYQPGADLDLVLSAPTASPSAPTRASSAPPASRTCPTPSRWPGSSSTSRWTSPPSPPGSSTTCSRTPPPPRPTWSSEFGRGDRRARGRRDQDRQARLLLPRGAAGRELPQDGGGHGARPARAHDQARRPPPQHADARLPAAGQGQEDRPGDARHLRAARAPPRHGQGQGRARGPRPPHAASRRTTRSCMRRVAKRRLEREAEINQLIAILHGQAGARWASRRGSAGGPSTSTPSGRRCTRAAASSTRSTTSPRCA